MRQLIELPKPVLFNNSFDVQSISILERGRKIIKGAINQSQLLEGEYGISSDDNELVFQINGKLHKMAVDEESKVKLYEVIT